VTTSISVLVADDQPLVRAGLREIFNERNGFSVVGEAGDGAEAIDLVAAMCPDVVVMDMRMPRIDGAEAIMKLSECAGAPPVLALTTYGDDDTVHAALRAGAAGFALKHSSAEDLHRAVRELAAGNGWIDHGVARALIQTFAATVPPADRDAVLGRLTDRELDVLRLVGRGHSNGEIAKELMVSTGTVKTHVSNLLAKLGLRDRVAAVVFVYEYGVTSWDPA